MEWKSHIVRAINQERAKIDILDNLTAQQVLVVMDWAMKWLPRSHRETQIEWFGKRGISWHVSACVTRAEDEASEFEVMSATSYAQDSFTLLTLDPYRTRVTMTVLQYDQACHEVPSSSVFGFSLKTQDFLSHGSDILNIPSFLFLH